MTDNGKTLAQTLVEIYGRIGDFHITPCDGAIPISEADRLAEKAVEDYTNALKAEIKRISSQRDAYLDGYKKAFADVVKLHDALQEARGSLYQCFRSSRDDALESHPDWAEHIADIHFEAATALAKIEAALEQIK
jgi:hypothetical protein